jgi:hypothetical protein
MFLQDLVQNGARTLIPLAHFAPNPALDSTLRLETDFSLLPQEIGSRIMIPSSDDGLRREVEARGFFMIEGMPQVYLMERQFPDGVLGTGPHAFPCGADYSIPVGMA